MDLRDSGIMANAFWHASQIPQLAQGSQEEHQTVEEKRRAFSEVAKQLRAQNRTPTART